MASFQDGLKLSSAPDKNVWLEFLEEIRPSKEFTICHWINIKFFNTGVAANLWSYCTVENKDGPMECLQLCLYGIGDTAYRNLKIGTKIPSREMGQEYRGAFLPLKSYHHRTWNHLCWSLSTITGNSRFYHNGEMIGSQQVNTTHISLALRGSSNMNGASFIFGQEPDSIGGGFDKFQAFIGDLSEFNVWNHTLSGYEIYSMAVCKNVRKGNVVSWDLNDWISKDKFGVHNVLMTTFSRLTTLCDISHRFVIFPNRVHYPEAKEVCEIHGGSLAVPHSERENKLFMDIVEKHQDACVRDIESTNGNLVWIGGQKVDGLWQELSYDSHHWSKNTLQSRLNFTKFLRTGSRLNSECACIRKDGFWLEEVHHSCDTILSLCTICIIYRQPVFTTKGICDDSIIDWNYYPVIDSDNQIQQYEGFKRKSNIDFDKESTKWKISLAPRYSQKIVFELLANSSSRKYPIGRKNWLIDEPDCGIDFTTQPFCISVCHFPFEFTCNSGKCVNVTKRCDGKKDCDDGSDEYLCTGIDLPRMYDNTEPPEPKIGHTSLEINIDARIIKINAIDTINMIVQLTIDMRLTWHDGRLLFLNPRLDADNIIADDFGLWKNYWTPMRNLIYENAIVGEIIYDWHEIKIQPTAPEPLDPSRAIENVIFNGSYNPLQLRQRMKIKYDCPFDVTRFPFDVQMCSFMMKINKRKMTSIPFINDHNAVYEGQPIIDQFYIGVINSSTNNTETSALFTINIHMARDFTNQVLNTFVPTLILWLFGYSTLFVSISDFNERFMGAGTSLLVIATLFSSISSGLPKTSYVKLIDIWFLWHNISILAIILCHIILNKLKIYLENLGNNEVTPLEDEVKKNRMKALYRGNNIVIMLFPSVNVLFYAIYFHFTFYQ